MDTVARVVLVAMLALGSGCAKPDWIQQTLVTVDVTGTWRSTEGGLFELVLGQQGSKVTGSMQVIGVTGVANVSGQINGTVSGDTFSFRGPFTGTATVSGDEMTGDARGVGQGQWSSTGSRIPFTLKRVDSSAPPRSQ